MTLAMCTDSSLYQGKIDETIIWKSLRHQNIHTFLAVAPFETPAFIIPPYCKNGNALEYLKRYPNTDRIDIVEYYAPTQIIPLSASCSVAWCMSWNGVPSRREYYPWRFKGDSWCHLFFLANVRHSQARNIIIADDGTPLVADFGVSRISRPEIQSSPRFKVSDVPDIPVNIDRHPVAGTVRWLSLEFFEGGEVAKPSDVWSMSMCAYEVSPFKYCFYPMRE